MEEVPIVLVTQKRWDEIEAQVASQRGFYLKGWYSPKETAKYLDIEPGILLDLKFRSRVHFKIVNGDHVVHSGYWIAECLLFDMGYRTAEVARPKYEDDLCMEFARLHPEYSEKLRAAQAVPQEEEGDEYKGSRFKRNY